MSKVEFMILCLKSMLDLLPLHMYNVILKLFMQCKPACLLSCFTILLDCCGSHTQICAVMMMALLANMALCMDAQEQATYLAG